MVRVAAPGAPRRLDLLRWGLIPYWAKEASDRQPHDQRPRRERRREARLPLELPQEALPDPHRRLL